MLLYKFQHLSMKHILPTLTLAALTTVSFAREHTLNVNRSVFSGSEKIAWNAELAKPYIDKAKSQFPGWAVMTDRRSGLVTNLYGDAMTIPGATPLQRAQYCMSGKLKEAGIMAGDWQLTRDADGPRAHFVDYQQYFSGHKVAGSRLGFRFTKDGRLTHIKVNTYGTPQVAGPSLTNQDAIAATVTTADINGVVISSKTTEKDWVWFPVPNGNKYELHPAWVVLVEAKVDNSIPLELKCYVDATDGKLLYRTNEVKEAVDVTVKGDVNVTGVSPISLEPLPNLLVMFGFGTYYTNINGFTSESAFNSASTGFTLAGRWSTVYDDNTFTTPSFTQNVVGTGNNITFNPAPYGKQHVNAYYHTDKVHDHMKKYLPSFLGMDFSLTTNVDNTTGTCNAFYSPWGNDINFFATGGGCNSFAEVADIVYHEYGHAINNEFYLALSTTFDNGAMNEGYADVWGMSITQDPVTGRGSRQVPGGGHIRRYDGMPRMYPRDIQGEVHADGEIIAGAWWDVAINWGSVDSMTRLFADTYYDLCNNWDGFEGQLYHDILISALENDDNDALLSNGTPHFHQIVSAFARHGIYLLGDVTFTHSDIINQQPGSPVDISAIINVQNTQFFSGASIYYKVRGSNVWSNLAMTGTGSVFTCQIPAQTAGTIIDYYFSAKTILSADNGFYPYGYDANPALATRLTIPYQFGVGLYNRVLFNFETPLSGWTVGNAPGDNATSGKWIQAFPMESYADPFSNSGISQPGADHTSGAGNCLVTGNASGPSEPVGDADVDNGRTTVITPVFDLSTYHRPIIEYFRWYSNTRGSNAGTDAWQVQIANSGLSNWIHVDSTFQADYSWRRRIFAVDEYLTAFNDVQLKFIASDDINPGIHNQGQGVVEAAVDDFFIYDDQPNSVGSGPSVGKASIYPSPADNYVMVALPVATTGTISLYDISGKIVKTIAMKENTTSYKIETSQLSAGHYSLLINTGHTIQSSSIVISHK